MNARLALLPFLFQALVAVPTFTVASLGFTGAAQADVVCSRAGSEFDFNGGYWTGEAGNRVQSDLTVNMRAKLENPDYFGPTGTAAPETLSFQTLSTLTSGSLAACDIYIGGGFQEGGTTNGQDNATGVLATAEANALLSWSNSSDAHFVIGGCDNDGNLTCGIFGRNSSAVDNSPLTFSSNSALDYNPITCGGTGGTPTTFGGASGNLTAPSTDAVLANHSNASNTNNSYPPSTSAMAGITTNFTGTLGAGGEFQASKYLFTNDADIMASSGNGAVGAGPVAVSDNAIFVINTFKFALDAIHDRNAQASCFTDYDTKTDLALTLATGVTGVILNDTTTLALTIENENGPTTNSILVSAPIPAGFTLVSSSSTDYDVTEGEWDVGSLAPNATDTLTLTVRRTAETPDPSPFRAEIIRSSLPDSDSAPNSGFGQDDLLDGVADDDEVAVNLTVATDYSDAPTTGTTYGDATHKMATGIFLGALVDSEDASLASPNADGDDASGANDEDGIAISNLTQSAPATITATVSGVGGYLQGWIDWNGNNAFDAGEQVATDLQDNGTGGDATAGDGTITFSVTPPPTAVTTQTFARFRWSTTSNLDTTTAASDGEVEDYAVTVNSSAPVFSCAPQFYQAYGLDGQLAVINLNTGSLDDLPNNPGYSVNATGYRVSDNYIYGTSPSNAHLVRYDSTGNVTDLGAVPGYTGANTGDFAGDGLLHSRGGGASTIFKLNVDTQTMTTYTLSPNIPNVADFAYNPVTGLLYGISAGATNNLYSINPNTGATVNVGATGITGNADFGAAFSDANGALFFAKNQDGEIYQVDPVTAAATLVGVGAPASNNDGASCPNASFNFLLDYSDAPTSGTSYGDATHSIVDGILLGSEIDADSGSLADPNANGDDNAGTPDDEDGVTIPTLTQGVTATIPVVVAGTGGHLQGWIDWDGDGNFTGANDRIATNVQDGGTGDSDGTVDGTISLSVAVPAGATTTQTFARFRWSTTQNLDSTTAASDGEVEDYAVTVSAASTISSGTLNYSTPSATGTNHGSIALLDWSSSSLAATPGVGNGTLNNGDVVNFPLGGCHVGTLTAAFSNVTNAGNFDIRDMNTWSGATAWQAYNGAGSGEAIHTTTDDLGFTIDWSLTINGVSRAPDIFFLDAEATSPVNESITAVTNGGAWSLTENLGNANYSATGIGSQTVVINDSYDSGAAYGSPLLLSEGTTRTTTSIVAGGNQAVAFGLLLPCDYGDAQAGYNAPSHAYRETANPSGLGLVPLAPAHYLGANVDAETTAQPTADAQGDDGDVQGDDEDGVTFPILTQGQSVTVPVVVVGSGGYLQGWVDWDGDGNFTGANDQIAIDVQDGGTGDTDGATNGTIALNVAVPANAATDRTFARFRWSKTSGLNATTAASDGEVEDYTVTVIDPSLTASCTAEANGTYRPLDFSSVNLGLTAGGSQRVYSDIGFAGDGTPLDAIISIAGDPASEFGNDGVNDDARIQVQRGTGFDPSIDVTLQIVEADTSVPKAVDGLLSIFDVDKNSRRTEQVTLTKSQIESFARAGTSVLDLEDSGATYIVTGTAADSTNADPDFGFEITWQNRSEITFSLTSLRINDTTHTGDAGFFIDGNLTNPALTNPDCSAIGSALDYSDAPLTGTTYGSASHTIDNAIRLGATITAEAAAYDTPAADGDSDDGVSSFPTLTQGNTAYTIPAANITATGTGTLHAWIDFDGDDAFATTEYASTSVTAGVLGGDLSWTGQGITATGTTIARLRLTSDTLTNADFATVASDGEVEDYQLTVTPLPAPETFSPQSCIGLDSQTFSALRFNSISPSNTFATSYRLGVAGSVNGRAVDVLANFDAAPAPGNGTSAPRVSNDDFIFVTSNANGLRTVDFSVVERGTTVPVVGNYVYQAVDLDQLEGLFVPDGQASEVTLDANTLITPSKTATGVQFDAAAGSRSSDPRDAISLSYVNRSSFSITFRSASPNGGFFFIGDYSTTLTNTGCPQLNVGKSASTSGALKSDGTLDVTYTIDVLNDGNSPLSSLTLVDDLTAPDQLGAAFNGIVAAPVVTLTNTSNNSTAPTTNGASYDGMNGLIIGTDGTLAPGDRYSVVFTVNVDPLAIGAPATLQNVATATGTTLFGSTFTDASDTDTDPFGGPDGTANVPDGPGAPTIVTVPIDYSDAPISGTGYGEATHRVTTGIRLGAAIDADTGSIANANASGDGADDDGVTLPTLVPGVTGTITVDVTGAGASLDAWIDWDGSGTFDDPVERVASDLVDGDGDGQIFFTVTPPVWATTSQTFARFRWSTDFAIGPAGAASDGEVEDYALTMGASGTVLSGRIFLDNGAGGGTAHDGSLDGFEMPAQVAMVTLTDNVGTVIATPAVGGDGRWSYTLPPAFGGSVTVTATPAIGYRTISEATTGLPSLVNADGRDGTYTFTPASGTDYTALDIGLIAVPTLTQDQSVTLNPGQVADLAHRYEATTDATVTFALVDFFANPADAFSTTVYEDTDCNGTPDQAMPTTKSVVAGQSVCLIVRTQVSEGVSPAASMTYGIEATTAYTDTTLSDMVRNDDSIGSGDGGGTLVLRKLVTNLSDATPVESTSNSGSIGDTLQYRLVLTNPGPGSALNVSVADMTPAYTALSMSAPSSVTVATGLTCNLVTPSAGANLPGYTGPLEWSCPGSLPSGATGSLTFQVTIAP